MIPWIQATMLSPKTTIAALIAALSVIATASAVPAFIPQAFAFIPEDDEGTTVTADQSNSFTANVDQSITQSAGTEDDDGSETTQDASQGFCLQVNQQNAAAGDDATNTAANAIAANEGSAVDCS